MGLGGAEFQVQAFRRGGFEIGVVGLKGFRAERFELLA